MNIPADVRALVAELESHMKRRREAGSVLLSADAFERWGPKDDPEQADEIFAAADEASEVVRETEAALDARVSDLRGSKPEVIEAWVAAHQALLDDFLGRTDDDTGKFVAKEEKEKWAAVLAGDAHRVHQNTFYVHYDKALYEELFGFPY